MTRRNVRKQGWVFLLFSPDSDDQLSLNFHRFVILYISCDTRSVGLWQYCLPKVSNGFKLKFYGRFQLMLSASGFSSYSFPWMPRGYFWNTVPQVHRGGCPSAWWVLDLCNNNPRQKVFWSNVSGRKYLLLKRRKKLSSRVTRRNYLKHVTWASTSRKLKVVCTL